MNRCDALAALMALPATARITRASVQPDDVIVVECDEVLSNAAMDAIQHHLRTVWPEPQRLLVLHSGLSVKVVEAKPVA